MRFGPRLWGSFASFREQLLPGPNVAADVEMTAAEASDVVRWMEHAYVHFMKPVQAEDVVNVYSLQESSSDWVPVTWRCRQVSSLGTPSKNASATGQGFYLERHALHKILADAKLWSQTALRVYMITGPPGVGKSEFTIWIAGRQLGVPVYRLCLSSPRLSDDRLAQPLGPAISPGSPGPINHCRKLQVDEFQETLQRWLAGHDRGTGVSAAKESSCLGYGSWPRFITNDSKFTFRVNDEHVKEVMSKMFLASIVVKMYDTHTSSTAQGGGGSFQDRSTIGVCSCGCDD
eukprot:Skav211372  [mRNA]  locus=scaffold2406:31368:43844:+ [translate_table: standard]